MYLSSVLLPHYSLSFKKEIFKLRILKSKEAVNWFYETDLLSNTDQQSGSHCSKKELILGFKERKPILEAIGHLISPRSFLERMTEG